MATEVSVVESFGAGEFGLLGPSGAPAGSFTARNMMVYQDGSIGPRPGIRQISPSGVPTGSVWGITSTASKTIVFGVGSTVYSFAVAPLGAVSSVGTLSGGTPSVTPVHMVPLGNDVYAVVHGDKGYKITPGSGVTALTSMPGGRTLCVYGERMITANTASNNNRVYYSAPADFTSWPVLNFFDVNFTWSISYLAEVRSRLAIANDGNEWWTLSGVPGINATLRRAPRADLSPVSPSHVTRLGESLWFLPCGEDFPAQFTGAVTDKLRYRYLAFNDQDGAGDGGASAVPSGETLVFTAGSDGRMLLFANNVWTVHTTTPTFGPLVTPIAPGQIGVNNGPLILCDGGGASTEPRFYVWNPALDRPGKTSDIDAQPGDGSDTPVSTYLYLPEHWTRRATELAVRRVVVDFAKWDTGSSSSNHFDLTVRALYRTGQAGYRDSKVMSFDEPASATTRDGTEDRRVFNVGDQGYAHGYQIRFDNLRGVAIRRIIVESDVSPVR